jgi:hypothetical protein
MGIENGELRMEVLKTQPFTVHPSPFLGTDCPMAIFGLGFGFKTENQKPETKNRDFNKKPLAETSGLI